MKLLKPFKDYLKNQKLSDVTVKNYLSDVKRFLDWSAKNQNSAEPVDCPDRQEFQGYIRFLRAQAVPANNLKRYLSALKKFGQFLADCGKTKTNPAAGLSLVTPPSLSAQPINNSILLNKYGNFLLSQKLAPATVKNYLTDARQFFSWLQNQYDQ